MLSVVMLSVVAPYEGTLFDYEKGGNKLETILKVCAAFLLSCLFVSLRERGRGGRKMLWAETVLTSGACSQVEKTAAFKKFVSRGIAYKTFYRSD